MDIKIKRNIAKNTKMKIEDIKEVLLLKLRDQGYKIIREEGTVLYFDSGDGRILVSRVAAFSRMDDGKFEVITFKSNQTLKLTYSISA
jgi:hypothetical protein